MNRRQVIASFVSCAVALAAVGASGPRAASAQANVVNVYSARHYGALEKVFAEFERETGIRVRLSNAFFSGVVGTAARRREGNASRPVLRD
jgi:iron(III) transport system substrate-binding protein